MVSKYLTIHGVSHDPPTSKRKEIGHGKTNSRKNYQTS